MSGKKGRAFTRKQAAEYLGLSIRWLEVHQKDGPKQFRPSPRCVRYWEKDLEDFAKQQAVSMATA